MPAGGLLLHPFTLTFLPRRSTFCGTSLRITPSGCYPPSCPVVSGLSSTSRRDRPQLHPELSILANIVSTRSLALLPSCSCCFYCPLLKASPPQNTAPPSS